MDPETLKIIADLEEEMAGLSGEERGVVRRKLRRLRQKAGSGIPMTRVRGGPRKPKGGPSYRVEGEDPEDSRKRHVKALVVSVRQQKAAPSSAEAVAYPLAYRTEVLLEKFEALYHRPPTGFSTSQLPGYLVLW